MTVRPASAPHPFCLLPVKAQPNASRDEICGWLGDAVKIKIAAPPLDGRANAALCEFLADRLGLPRRAVGLERGDSARLKLVRVEGLDLATVKTRLGL